MGSRGAHDARANAAVRAGEDVPVFAEAIPRDDAQIRTAERAHHTPALPA